ncbi:MAG: trigger factor [Oligoflexia bacterium]|nr:trigger factor [Oligoflexia bacterium]
MSYTTEDVGKCSKKFIFNLTEIDLSTPLKDKLIEKQKKADFKGYRKGKVPMSVIEQFYKPQLEDEIMREYLSNQFYKAIDETKTNVIGNPVFSNVKYDSKDGKGEATFDVVVDFVPEFKLIDPNTLTFVEERVEVSDEDINNIKEQMRSYRSELVVIEGSDDLALINGNYAIADFKAFDAEEANGESGNESFGQEIEKLNFKDRVLEIGTGLFIADVEDQMIGMKKGEKKEIITTIPDKFYQKDFVGKRVRFEVLLIEIKELKKPEFDDAFVSEMGYQSIEDFENKSREGVRKYKENEVKKKLYQEIMEKLVESIPIDLPQSIIQAQEEATRKNIDANLKQQRMNETQVKEYFEKWDEDIKKRSEFQVRIDFILNKFADEYEIDVTNSDLDKRYEEMSHEYRSSVEEIRKFYNDHKNSKQKLNLIYTIREEKTLKRLSEMVRLN